MTPEETLEKVRAAIQKIDSLVCLADAIYDVREREGEGWHGPKVTEYQEALNALRELGCKLR